MGDRTQQLLEALKKSTVGGAESAYRMGSGLAAGIPGILHTGVDVLSNVGEPNFMERAKGSVEKGARTSEHILKALEEMGPHTKYHDEAVRAADEGMGLPGKLVGQGADWVGNNVSPAAGLAVGLIGDAGLNGLLNGKPVSLKAPSKVRGVIPWQEMTAEQARAFASKNGHLRASTGGYTKMYNGAPDWIKTPGDLRQFRTQLDAAIREGAPIVIDNKGTTAKDWYPEARGTIAAVTKNPENAEKLANVTATYSANKSVPQDIDLTLKHHVLEALKPNDEAVAAMPGDKLEASKAGAIFRGELTNPPGPKIEPFSEAINPFNDKEPNRSVNDTRMIGFFGYAPGTGTKPTQHSFMTGEMHAAHARAMKKGILPPDSDVHSAQAAAWATIAGRGGESPAEGLGSFFHKHAANVTYEPGSPGAPGHMEGINDEAMDTRRAHADNMAWAKPGQADPLYDALNIPQEGRTTGMGNWRSERPDKPAFEAAILDPKTGEDFAGHMHFDAFNKMPAEAMSRMEVHPEEFTHGFLDPQGEFLTRGEAHDAAKGMEFGSAGRTLGAHFGKPMLASEDMRGIKRRTVERIEHNPLHVAHPLLPWEDQNAGSLLNQVETFRATMDAQKGFGWNRVRELPKKNAGSANAMKIALEKAPDDRTTRTMYRNARRAGLNLIDNGDGNFTLTGNDWAGTDPKAFQDTLGEKSVPAAMLRALEGKPGTVESGYGEIPWGKDTRVPEGVATANLLEAVSPKVGAALHTPQVSELLLNKNKAEALADMESHGARKSGPARSIHNLRAMVAEHGVEGLREKVSQLSQDREISYAEAAAKLGLPAWLIASLYGQEGKTNDSL